MYVFAEPVTEEQVQEIQTRNKEKIIEFERNVLGLHKESTEDDSASNEADKWADIRADVEEAMTKDEQSLGASSNQEPLPSAAGHSSDSWEDDTALKRFETINRGPLYERQRSLEADDVAAAATADEVDNEDENEDDDVLDEEEDESAENEGENDSVEVQKGEEEGEAGITEESDANGEEVEEVGMEEEDEAENEEESGVIGEEEATGMEEEDEADIADEIDVIDEEVENAAENSDEEVEDAAENGDEDELADEASTTTEPESSDLDSVAQAEASTEVSEHSEPMAEAADPSAPSTPLHEAEAEAQPEAQPEPEPEGEDSRASGDSTFLDSIATSTPSSDLLALTLTLRNKVNNAYVLRPNSLGPSDIWSVEYSIAEASPQTRAWSLYQACQARRKKHLEDEEQDEERDDDDELDYYIRKIRECTKKGREWREEQDRIDQGRPVWVVGETGPREMGGNGGTTATAGKTGEAGKAGEAGATGEAGGEREMGTGTEKVGDEVETGNGGEESGKGKGGDAGE